MASPPPTRSLAVFLSIILTINVGLTLFLGGFITKGWALSGQSEVIIWVSLGSIIPLFILSEVARRKRGWSQPYLIGSVLLGSLSIAVAAVSFGYVALLLGFLASDVVPIVLTSIPLLSFLALINNLRGPKIITIDLRGEPAFKSVSSPLTLVHLTDIHLSHHTRTSWVKKVVDLTNSLHPDFILFTGDLIDIDPKLIPEKIAHLKKMQAKYGKLAVSGNHDFMTGIDQFYALCQQLGFECLDHAAISRNGLTFMGVPDEMSPHFKLPQINNCGEPIIFLKHRPTHFKQLAHAGVALQLSGHSHKGQLPPWGTLVKLRYSKYAYGLHKLKNSLIYTSRGTGVWGPPMRLFRRSEIIEIKLGSQP